MAIADDLHTLFKARRKSFEIIDDQPTYYDLHRIVEELIKILFPIQFDEEGGKHNIIGLIMDKADYINRLGAPFPRPNRPAIYNESIADSVTGVIQAKAKSVHHACIIDWDAFKVAEGEARRFIINEFDEARYSELCKPVTFYAQVTTGHMLEHLQGICFGNHTIEILDLQEKCDSCTHSMTRLPNTFRRSRNRSSKLQEWECQSCMQHYS